MRILWSAELLDPTDGSQSSQRGMREVCAAESSEELACPPFLSRFQSVILI